MAGEQPSWMQTGPGPLDLTTPLVEGEKQGMMQAYRQDQIKERADRLAQMQAALGLQQKHEAFEENMWNAQSGLRSAQMTLAQNQATDSSRQLDNVANDQALVQNWTHDFNEKIANQDFEGALNMPAPDGLKTPQAMQAIETARNSAATMPAGKAFVENQQAVALGNADIIKGATSVGINVADPKYKNPDGTTNYPALQSDVMAKNTALGIANLQKETDIKTEGEVKVMNARYQGLSNVVGQKTQSAQTVALLNTAERRQTAASKALSDLQQKVATGVVVDPVALQAAQKEQADATANYRAIQSQVTGAPQQDVNTPDPVNKVPTQIAPAWLGALRTNTNFISSGPPPGSGGQ